MGQSPVPRWLPAAYVRSMEAIGATVTKLRLEEACNSLLEKWCEKRRHFHNVHHLASILQHLDDLASSCHDPELVRIAAWYHGIVFNDSLEAVSRRLGGEDAKASAEFAGHDLKQLGVPGDTVDRIQDLILKMTRGAKVSDDVDAQVLRDAEFSILAAIPQEYREYRKAVRREYAHITERNYVIARINVVHRILSRPAIFVSPFGVPWESQARQNLEGEMTRLVASLPEIGVESVEEALKLDPAAEEVASAEEVVEKTPDTSTSETLIIKGMPRASKSDDADMRDSATGAIHIIKADPATGEIKRVPVKERFSDDQATPKAGIKIERKSLKDRGVDAKPKEETVTEDDNSTSTLESAIDSFD